MKKGGTLYLIYVDGVKLNPNGFLRKLYEQRHVDARFFLYAVTIDPELLEGFFIFHKKEYFIIKKKKIKDMKISKTELEKKFGACWLRYVVVDVGVWLNKKLKHQRIAMVLTESEENEIGYELEALDEFLYDWYVQLDTHKELIKHKVFEDNIMKALKNIGLKKITHYLESMYGDVMDRGIPVTYSYLNEWGALQRCYGEVLIGGDNDEDSYI